MTTSTEFKIAIMQAWVDRKTIIAKRHNSSWTNIVGRHARVFNKEPHWNWAHFDYKIEE